MNEKIEKLIEDLEQKKIKIKDLVQPLNQDSQITSLKKSSDYLNTTFTGNNIKAFLLGYRINNAKEEQKKSKRRTQKRPIRKNKRGYLLAMIERARHEKILANSSLLHAHLILNELKDYLEDLDYIRNKLIEKSNVISSLEQQVEILKREKIKIIFITFFVTTVFNVVLLYALIS